jgi:hypothetical protein
MPYSAQYARVVALDPHAPTPAETLLPPPEFAIDGGLGYRDASGQT